MATDLKVAEKRTGTKDRILEAARLLFNRGGVQGTAVFRIAYELDMSPGNLTYHFKSKADIVLELARALRARVEEAIFGLQPPLRAAEVIAHLEIVLGALWSYRFLFNSGVYVSQMDEDLARQIGDVQNRIRDILTNYFENTISRGEMRRPTQEDGVALLCDNILALWLQWLQAESAGDPEPDAPDPAALRNCMRHHYSLMDPYVSRAFAQQSWAEIARRYGAA